MVCTAFGKQCTENWLGFSGIKGGIGFAMTPCPLLPTGSGPVAPIWRRFVDLTPSEAAFVTACWSGDPKLLDVSCLPGKTTFVVASPATAGASHWAAFSADGVELDDGWEASVADAKRVATEARELWSHRCDEKEHCRCAAFLR